VERPGRKERFARLIHRPVRVLGGPAVRAAFDFKWGCPIEGCGQWFLGPWYLEGHTVTEHPGWTATYELVRPYPNQRQRVVYRRSAPPAS
jgi:hypothetical protein